jgi:hypothetical protein
MSLNKMLQNMPPRDPRIAFWSNPKTWPVDTGEHIFLARAVLDLARLRYGANWSEEILSADIESELPTDLTIYTQHSEIVRASQFLRESSESYKARSGGFGLLGPISPGPDFPTREEWAEAVAIAKKRSDEFWLRYMMFFDVALELSVAFKNSNIATFTRPHLGGEPILRPWHFWNMERGWRRFETCRVDPKEEMSGVTHAGEGLWLFVHRKAFEEHCSGPAKKPENETAAVSEIDALKRSRGGGRLPSYEWHEIYAEYQRIIYEDGFPDDASISDVARRLWTFCDDQLGKAPDVDYLRAKIRIWRSRIPRRGGEN